MTDDIFIPDFSADDLASVKAELGLSDIDESVVSIPQVQPQPKRRRGRPRKHPLPEGSQPLESSTVEKIIEPAKLTKRDEREVAERLSKLLTGATGLASIATKPYVEMTDEEAKDIAEPLSSYLVRNADTIPIARQILENYDLAAITLGVIAYLVRIYGDRRNELASRPQSQSERNTQRPTLVRVSEIQEQTNERQSRERANSQTGIEDTTRFVASQPFVPGVQFY